MDDHIWNISTAEKFALQILLKNKDYFALLPSLTDTHTHPPHYLEVTCDILYSFKVN